MNFERIEEKILEWSKSELDYFHQLRQPKYDNAPTVYVDNQAVLRFGKDMFININTSEEFLIRKQSRFVPVPLHITDVIEVNYVYKGSSVQYVNGQKIQLLQGDLIIIDTNATHKSDAVGEDDIVISLNISQTFFKDNFLNQLTQRSVLSDFLFQAISQTKDHNQFLLFRNQKSNTLRLLFQQLMNEVYFPSLLTKQVKEHLLQLILLELICSFSVEVNGTQTNDAHQQLMLNVLTYINVHFATITLQQCARHFGYNSSYLSTLIKTSLGKSFKVIVQEKRLEESISLLLHTNKSIKDIAFDVGFSNLNQYYKLFEAHYHMTPAQYRKNNAML